LIARAELLKKVVVTKFVDGGEQVSVDVAVGVIVEVGVRVGVRVNVSVIVGVNLDVSVTVGVSTAVAVSVVVGFSAIEVSEVMSGKKKPTTSRGAFGWEVN
jgi:hypothetical protein